MLQQLEERILEQAWPHLQRLEDGNAGQESTLAVFQLGQPVRLASPGQHATDGVASCSPGAQTRPTTTQMVTPPGLRPLSCGDGQVWVPGGQGAAQNGCCFLGDLPGR